MPLGLAKGWQFNFQMELQLGTFSGTPSSPTGNVTLIAPDGSGYRAVEGIILQADKVNPALGSRLLTAFEQWRILEPRAKAEAEATLKRLQAAGLSSNSADIVARALG